MAAARKSKDAVSSGSETMSGNKTDSGAKSRNGTEAAPNQAAVNHADPSQADLGGDSRPPAITAIRSDKTKISSRSCEMMITEAPASASAMIAS